jgi:hypothetical protein
MTPSPERNESSGMLNKKSTNLNSVERTTEKYSGFYNMGKNVRTTKNAKTNNRNDDNEDANENENDTDDEFEIGILNLSNHDINDDDEVLQGVSYLTPPSKSLTHTKNTPKNSIKNTSSGTKNSMKIPSKTLTPKGPGFAENKSTANVQYKQNYVSLKTVKTPVKRFLIEKREVSDRKEKLNDGKYNWKNDGKSGVTCVFMDGVRSDEMAEMTAQIKALTCELKYFEELTGKRCIFETKVRCTQIHSHTYKQNHIHVDEHTRRHMFIFTHTHTCKYMYMYIYIHTYTRVHVIAHTQTYMHTPVHFTLNYAQLIIIIIIIIIIVTIQIHFSSCFVF